MSNNKTKIAEIVAVVITAIGKFIFIDAMRSWLPFVLAAIIGWVGYIIYRNKTDPGIAKHWGFRTDNFRSVLKRVLPFGLFAVAACIGIGLFQGTINITWHIIPILILYPIWGVIQQFLLIALTAGNMQDLKWNKTFTVIIAALLFGAIHYPFLWLILGSFVLALFYGFIYLKERNLYVLGLFHGWLGGIFYYTVMERDPFVEVFGGLF